MKSINVILFGLLSLLVLSCSPQQKVSSVKFNIKNVELLKSTLNITLVTDKSKDEILIEDIINNNVDTVLKCKTPYIIRFYGEGIVSKTIKYYNNNCNDTAVVISLEPIKVFH